MVVCFAVTLQFDSNICREITQPHSSTFGKRLFFFFILTEKDEKMPKNMTSTLVEKHPFAGKTTLHFLCNGYHFLCNGYHCLSWNVLSRSILLSVLKLNGWRHFRCPSIVFVNVSNIFQACLYHKYSDLT